MVNIGHTEIRRNRKHLLPVQERPETQNYQHQPVHIQPAKVTAPFQQHVQTPQQEKVQPVQPQTTPVKKTTRHQTATEQPATSTAQEPVQATVSEPVPPSPFKTRSGRVVKPNPRYNSELFERT